MCDTMVALGNATSSGNVIFAKNSDRQANEPLLTIRVPRKKYPPGSRVKCTYIEVDQAEETYEVLLIKPSWIWGAEMGANEFGLNIGNEAVFTREKQGPPALLGMDMLRLALERCRNSDEALDLLIELLQKYGQGGNCGYEKNFFYHNSFLIADPNSAWVLETAGQYWAAERVRDVRSISNCLSIGKKFDRCHPDLISHAIEKKWCRNESDFNFARCYSDKLITRFSGSGSRCHASASALEEEKGKITRKTMKKILRTHEELVEGKQFSRHSLKSVCMHGGFIFGDHTTGSYIGELSPESPTYLITGSSTPCIAVYKPFWFIGDENFTFKEEEFDEALRFWLRREKFHRYVIENRISRLNDYILSRDRLEERLDEQIDEAVKNREDSRLGEIIGAALLEEENLLEKHMRGISGANKPARIKGSIYFRYYWKKSNKKLFSRHKLDY